jgi:hypothetical protein
LGTERLPATNRPSRLKYAVTTTRSTGTVVVVVVVEVVGAVVVVLPGPVVEGEVLDDGTVVGALDVPESPQPTKIISAAIISAYRQSFDVIAFPIPVVDDVTKAAAICIG